MISCYIRSPGTRKNSGLTANRGMSLDEHGDISNKIEGFHSSTVDSLTIFKAFIRETEDLRFFLRFFSRPLNPDSSRSEDSISSWGLSAAYRFIFIVGALNMLKLQRLKPVKSTGRALSKFQCIPTWRGFSQRAVVFVGCLALHILTYPLPASVWRSPGPPGALAPQQSGRTCGAVVEVEFPRSDLKGDPRSIFMGKPAFVDIKSQ